MGSYLRFLLSLFLITQVLVAVIALTAFVFVTISGTRPGARPTPTPFASPSATAGASPTPGSPSPTETAAPPVEEPTASPPPPDATPPPAAGDMVKLIIPVAGVRASDLRDTFNEARSEGRVHNAIDIMAPRSASVLAAADGEIVKLFYSDRGGITIYQMTPDKKFVFYYAHLERYADRLAAGQRVRQGEVIGYVGDTGNAAPGSYHLHFSIWIATDPRRYWDGININPYPILRNTP